MASVKRGANAWASAWGWGFWIAIGACAGCAGEGAEPKPKPKPEPGATAGSSPITGAPIAPMPSAGAPGMAPVGSAGSGPGGSAGTAGGAVAGSSAAPIAGSSAMNAGAAAPVAGSGEPSAAGAGGAQNPGAGNTGDAAGAAGSAGSSAMAGSSAPASGMGCSASNPLDALLAFAPDDEDLAKDFEQYLREEIGAVTCATQGSGNARTISDTILVPAGAVYDGKGETLKADAAKMKCDLSEGEQAESQRPYFLLAPGAQLRNVTIEYPGCEGVHMMGDNTLEHITWNDAGEDAASVRSYFPGGKIVIKDSAGHKAADKMFQFNAPCDVRIERFTGSDMGKLVRQNGGTEFELRIDLNTVTVTGVISAVVQSDSPACFVRYHALSYTFTGSGDKSDRVFRDIPPANVTTY